jgi:hypothetical protein
MPTPRLRSSPAKHGDKMIELRVRFFTNGIARAKGKIVMKNAWDGGFVAMDSNESHGISPKPPKPFNSILQLQAVIADVLTDHSIVLHRGQKLRKLFKGRKK